MHEGSRFLSKTLVKSIFHFQNDRSCHDPAAQFRLLESAFTLLQSRPVKHFVVVVVVLFWQEDTQRHSCPYAHLASFGENSYVTFRQRSISDSNFSGWKITQNRRIRTAYYIVSTPA